MAELLASTQAERVEGAIPDSGGALGGLGLMPVLERKTCIHKVNMDMKQTFILQGELATSKCKFENIFFGTRPA